MKAKHWRKAGALLLVPLLGIPAVAACTSAATEQSLPEITIYTVGSSSVAACERIGQALSELTAEHLGFTVSILQTSTASYDENLERSLLMGEDIDLFCYADLNNMFSLVSDGKAVPLETMLADFPALVEAVPEDYWSCMTYEGHIVAVPGNNSNRYSIGFEVRADIMDDLGVSASDITTLEALGDLFRQVKQAHPDVTPLVPHFGQIIQTLDVDPLSNGLGVLLGNTGTEVVNLYSSDYFAEICATMHDWYKEGLILNNAPLTNIPSARALRLYSGFAFAQRGGNRNIVSINRSVGMELDTITLTSLVQNTSALNVGWCVNAKSDEEDQRRALQLLEYLYTDQEAADLLLYGVEEVDYHRIDENTVTSLETVPEDEWSTIHWGQPNSAIVSQWVRPDGTTVNYKKPEVCKVSPAYGFTYSPSANLRPKVNACLQIVDKYQNALLSGYLDPEETLPLFCSELEAAGIEEIIQEKQQQLDAWLAGGSVSTPETSVAN